MRPEFFSDGRVSRLAPEVRLTYIGLWCVADDAGWLAWDVSDLGAQLYPYESIRVRERRLTTSGEALVAAGRMVLYPCGCAAIPTLAVHQKIGGTKSFTARDRHDKHPRSDKSRHSRTRPSPDKSIESGTNPPVGSELGSELNGRASASEDDDYSASVLAAQRRQGLPVDILARAAPAGHNSEESVVIGKPRSEPHEVPR